MGEMTVRQALDYAVGQHRAGRVAEAEGIYRQILEVEPDNGATLQMLALLYYETGRRPEAAETLGRAIAVEPGNAALLGNLGAVLADLGKFDEALAAVRRAISLGPDSPASHGILGNILSATGDLDGAVAAYRQALVLDPASVETWINLGNALGKKGDRAGAVESYRRAVALRPDLVEARANLAHALKDSGRPGEAVAVYREAISLRPGTAQLHVELGNALVEADRCEEAVAEFRRAIAIAPVDADAWYGLGVAFGRGRELDQAIGAFKEAVRLRPNDAHAHTHLGIAYYERGMLEASIAAHRRAVACAPNFAEAHNNLGLALHAAERSAEAVAAFRQALSARPNYPEALNNLGLAYEQLGKPDEAIGAYRRAVAARPGFAQAQNNLGNVLKEIGRLDEALVAYRESARASHLPWMHGNLLFALYAHQDVGPEELYREHVQWAERFVKPLVGERKPHSNDRKPERRLRVGWVSPDFNQHPVGRFLLPLFENIDRGEFEMFCYADGHRNDWVTDALKKHADQWQVTAGFSDVRVAEGIRADAIDILIDLTSQTKDNRLLVFARKPAPVQATYLAYGGTTGVDAIDYRITDPYLDPTGTDEAFYFEKSVRLPHTYWCYQGPPEAGPVTLAPVEKEGQVTFGCLNTFSKVTPQVINTWARILKRVPTSRLLLHCREGTHRTSVTEAFRRERVDVDRIQCVPRTSRPDYFRLYQHIDIGLDPFPYPGGTTTCDALWMGVPVITLKGRTAVSRGGFSVLSNVGLPELVAESIEGYIGLAGKLAGDRGRIVELRSTLRERMLRSPLMDAPGFARDFGEALRGMWRRWCAAPASV